MKQYFVQYKWTTVTHLSLIDEIIIEVEDNVVFHSTSEILDVVVVALQADNERERLTRVMNISRL